MTPPHDFEFQLGKNRALKGRGWRGLAALALVLITCVTITTESSWIVSPLRATMGYFGR
jgi:hypothetical protein